MRKVLLIRNLEAPDLLENFLVSAVVSIIGIRYFLFLTNYPQVGGDGLHIAHMLWGGLFMLLAIILFLSFLNKSVYHLASIIGGVGFGTFIDELGKFITKDNNYFFQPTIALIYIIFILLYLSSKAIQKSRQYTKEEYLINSIEALKEVVVEDLDDNEKRKTLEYLKNSDPNNPVTKILKHTLNEIRTIPTPKPNPLTQTINTLNSFYKSIIQKNWFSKLVISIFLLDFLGTITQTLIVIGAMALLFFPNLFISEFYHLDFSESLNIGLSFITGILIAIGVINMKRSRLKAYEWFKRSILISIFLIQIFAFYEDQLTAIFGLLGDITLLIALDYMISREQAKAQI